MAKKQPTSTPAPSSSTVVPTAKKSRFTLDDVIALSSGADTRMRTVLFRNVSEASLLSRGLKIDTQNILDDVPAFAFDTRTIYAGLKEAQRALLVGYAPVLDHLLGEEVGTLAKLHAAHKTQSQSGSLSRAKAKAAVGQTWTAAITLRNQAARALSRLLGNVDESQAEVRASKGLATTEEELATGLEALAGLIAQHRAADADLRHVMDQLQLTDAYAESLRKSATQLRKAAGELAATAPEARVSQRQLDLQDGAVLHVVESIYRAFRDAHGRDETILLPRLGAMAAVIDRARGGAAKTAPAPAVEAAAAARGEAPANG